MTTDRCDWRISTMTNEQRIDRLEQLYGELHANVNGVIQHMNAAMQEFAGDLNEDRVTMNKFTEALTLFAEVLALV